MIEEDKTTRDGEPIYCDTPVAQPQPTAASQGVAIAIAQATVRSLAKRRQAVALATAVAHPPYACCFFFFQFRIKGLARVFLGVLSRDF